MRILEKISLVLFSLIISVISIVLILVMFKLVSVSVITATIVLLFSNDLAFKITLGVTIVALLLAIKCIFFRAKPEDDGRNGVVLENSSGKLVISKESLENLIANVVKEVQGIEAVSSRTILDKDGNVVVYVTTLVSKDMMIKDASSQIQEKIKQVLKRTADLEVKQVNIKVKNITNKKIKGLPPAEDEETTEEPVVQEETITEQNEDQ